MSTAYAQPKTQLVSTHIFDQHPQVAVHFKAELQSKQPLVKKILGQLIALIQHPEARSQDNECATDNAVSAVRAVTTCVGWWYYF